MAQFGIVCNLLAAPRTVSNTYAQVAIELVPQWFWFWPHVPPQSIM